MYNSIKLIDKLNTNKSLSIKEYTYLLDNICNESIHYAKQLAITNRTNIYSKDVYLRALIEVSNYCKNSCYYCGINASNNKCDRYRLSLEEILICCDNAYKLNIRTFVLQAGEDIKLDINNICTIIKTIKNKYIDCAITLSLGEFSKQEYELMYKAGANRYLLRHETYNKEHYHKLHPTTMSFSNRIQCLHYLKEIGYQVGCGFMVGSPHQTNKHIANDLKFIEQFKPDMCGIGPFIPHIDTKFKNVPPGNIQLVLFLLSIIRIIQPNILLPATTALSSIDNNGRTKGILSGANVIMPNFSPILYKDKYSLYNNKNSINVETITNIKEIEQQLKDIGYKVNYIKGDIIKENNND